MQNGQSQTLKIMKRMISEDEKAVKRWREGLHSEAGNEEGMRWHIEA